MKQPKKIKPTGSGHGQSNGKKIVQLEDALSCAKELAKLGVALKEIDIGTLATPRIRVNRQPRGLENGMVKIQGSGGGRTVTKAASLNHCQVEWKETA